MIEFLVFWALPLGAVIWHKVACFAVDFVRIEIFKDDVVGILLCSCKLFVTVDCPHKYGAKKGMHLYPKIDRGNAGDVICDEIRARDEVYPTLSHINCEETASQFFDVGRAPCTKLADRIV